MCHRRGLFVGEREVATIDERTTPMSSFQQQQAARIEYRQTGWLKAANIVISGVILAAGILCFYFTFVRFHPSIQDSIRGVIGVVLFLAGGVYYLAMVLRARILIDGTRITDGNASGERSADLTEIEGVRDVYGKNGKAGGSVTGKLLLLKDGRDPISISLMTLDLDDRFSDWLKQLPSLD
jgi:hypothetical protein